MAKLKLDGDVKIFGKSAVGLNNKPLGIKDLLLNIVGSHVPKDGKETIKIYSIGSKIDDAKKEIELSDEDIALIKRIISANGLKLTVGVLGGLCEGLGLDLE